jgi:NAD dependent epimerase/dehydratase family
MLRTTSVLCVGGICAIAGIDSTLGERVAGELRASGNWEVRRFPRLGTAWDSAHGVGTLVILNVADYDAAMRRQVSVIEDVTHCLQTASEQGIERVVFLSSAMVYGAWSNNPVPLTEDSAVRPNPGLQYTSQLATAEQLVNQWQSESRDRSAVILRSVPVMSARHTGALVRALAAGLGTRTAEDDAPAQFLHEDDLASAIRIVMQADANGVYNVAPDGSIPGDSLRALSGAVPKIKLPEPLAAIVADLRWKFQRGPIPPGLRDYVHFPWIISNGKIRSLGWNPSITNEQAFVEGTESKWWTMLTPKRKQELSLALMILGAVALSFGVITVVRKALKGR